MRLGRLTELEPDARIEGTIVASLMPGWWIVEDDQGRRFRATSPNLWRKGEWVVVQGEQILGAIDN